MSIKRMLRNTQEQRSSHLTMLSQHMLYGLPVAMETQNQNIFPHAKIAVLPNLWILSVRSIPIFWRGICLD